MSHTTQFDLEIRLLLAGLLFIVAITIASSYRDMVIMTGMLFNVAIILDNLIMIGLLFNIAIRLASVEII